MTDLAALLARVEGASGPDREIDAEVCLAFGAAVEAPQRNGFGEIIVPAWWTMPGASRATWPHRATPWLVTASLDAAVALAEQVLPRPYIDLSGPRRYLNLPAPVPNYWRAALTDFEKADAVGWGATPALALVAAIIRAKMGEAG